MPSADLGSGGTRCSDKLDRLRAAKGTCADYYNMIEQNRLIILKLPHESTEINAHAFSQRHRNGAIFQLLVIRKGFPKN